MALHTQKMRDARGKVATYRLNANNPDTRTGHPEPPARPHPDELLRVRWSGYFIPSSNRRPLAETAAYYEAHPESEGHPISGDECARVRRSQCGDTGQDPATGCRGPEHCAAAPHEGGAGWIDSRVPRYRDIAHTLYLSGQAPVPATRPGPSRPEPEQLDLLTYLTSLTTSTNEGAHHE